MFVMKGSGPKRVFLKPLPRIIASCVSGITIGFRATEEDARGFHRHLDGQGRHRRLGRQKDG